MNLRNKYVKIFLFIVSFFICRLEWAGNNAKFLFEVVFDIFYPSDHLRENLLHPMVLFPLSGIFILFVGLFISSNSNKWISIGIILCSILVLLILFIGISTLNLRIILSCIPFVCFSVWHFMDNYKLKKQI